MDLRNPRPAHTVLIGLPPVPFPSPLAVTGEEIKTLFGPFPTIQLAIMQGRRIAQNGPKTKVIEVR